MDVVDDGFTFNQLDAFLIGDRSKKISRSVQDIALEQPLASLSAKPNVRVHRTDAPGFSPGY